MEDLEVIIKNLRKDYPFSNVVLGFHFDVKLLKECIERLDKRVVRFLEEKNVEKK